MSTNPNPGGLPVDDKGKVITHDLIPGHKYEVIVRAIGPDGTMQPMEEAARNAIVIQGKLASPNAIVTFTAAAFIEAITLSWTKSPDFDLDYVEIWRSATNDIDTAEKVAEASGITYLDDIGLANVTRYYWIRAVNTSRQSSIYYPDTTAGVSGTTVGIVATDIADFAVTATKMFNKTIILNADVWSNNSPGAGSIAWNAHSIVYNGTSYPITAGNTALAYVYWTAGAATYSEDTEQPILSTPAFMIAINTAGIHTLVWNSSANMVIGTAFIANLAVTNAKIGLLAVDTAQIAALAVETAKIKNLAVTNAKINTVTANKLTAGTIDASVITVSNLVVGTNVAIGTAEDAAGVTTIVGNTIDTGYINALEITTVGAVTAGSLTGLIVQTAASGQRTVLDVTDNTIRVYDALGNNVLTIDDDILRSGTNPSGILINDVKGGFIGVQDIANDEWVNITEEYIHMRNGTIHHKIFPGTAVEYQIGTVGDPDAYFAIYGVNGGACAVKITGLLTAGGGIAVTGNLNISGVYKMDAVTIIDATKNITNIVNCSITGVYSVDGTQVLSSQKNAVANATGSGDAWLRLNELLAQVRAHGLLAT